VKILRQRYLVNLVCFFSRTNITIGTTDKFVYKEVSECNNTGTKIYPQTRVDSYGIEVSQSKIWLVFGIIFSIVLPILIDTNFIASLAEYNYNFSYTDLLTLE
jgi:hypothetical protein